MRLPIIKQYTAAGKVPVDGRILVPVNYIQAPFEVACGILFSEDAAAAAGVGTVQFTYDSMSIDDFPDVGISQTTTVVTVTDPSLPLRGGIAVGDVAKLYGVSKILDGEYVVASAPTPTTYTVTSGTSQSFTGLGKAGVFRLFNSVIANAAVARAYGVLSAGVAASGAALAGMNSGPCTGVCLNLTVLTAGSAYLTVVQGSGSR